jgi:hypothetical protein
MDSKTHVDVGVSVRVYASYGSLDSIINTLYNLGLPMG